VRNYLITISRRFFRWIIAAVVAVLFYGVATLIGLSQTLVL